MNEKTGSSPEFQRFNQLTALLVSVPKNEIKEKPKPRARKPAKRKKQK